MGKEKPAVVMTLPEVARYLRVNRSTIYHLAQQGLIPASKVGRQWRFHPQVIEEWLKSGGVPISSGVTRGKPPKANKGSR